MKILGIDSSGMTASVALVTDAGLVSEYTVNNKRTHSETLLPMIDEMLRLAGTEPEELTAIAIASGPGSFTGLRIGAATAKGLALALDIPIIPVPTLDGQAYNLAGDKRLVVSVMDARRNEVYAGAYRVHGETGERINTAEEGVSETGAAEISAAIIPVLTEDALPVVELFRKLNEIGEEVVFVGDGIPVVKKILAEISSAFAGEAMAENNGDGAVSAENSGDEAAGLKVPYSFAPANNAAQRGASVAVLGGIYFEEGKAINSDDFAPEYLRKSQAERVRDEKSQA
ncbi:MAG: tRNA (adenosine(37)-N6)-threonylcarbamoyltransferase complex dimerization subunit type 1 TsaB [Eubacterium sp.]|nr:tRNA (adenosine(37)-N6)-threonylcarbamoyltransferase complex dimerization subunit type 1 TsaB [Eubacterium sp.]